MSRRSSKNNPNEKKNKSLKILNEMSNILETGLDEETLSLVVSLLEQGVNPDALTLIIKKLRRERSLLESQTETQSSTSSFFLPKNFEDF
ncbi:mitotic-spindle organizing protein [Anaeramoeba flamelloides]|uniref:Mitotic-spindle organizing protein n=1 Tax=Anaeramoeba flamelloides TaxID=1746091 RepID=A0AAV7Z4D0_9EUKA|nr:mitotic-spindle organizing protein [Anaeramoeba flamelloides]